MRSSHAKPWSQVVALTERQEGLLRRTDLLGLGYHQRQIRRLVLNGRLQVVHPGVYAVGHRAISRRAQFQAAVWWAGDRAALSHESAAAFYGWIREDPDDWPPIHVSVPVDGVRSRDGVIVHRTRHLDHRDTMGYGELTVTDRVRTLIDLADHLAYERLREVADELPSLPKARLASTARRLPGRVGAGRMQRLIHSDDADARSVMERRSVRYFALHGVPEPDGRNVRVHGVLVDCWYRGAKLVVELDSRAHHSRRKELTKDRHRDRALKRQGSTPCASSGTTSTPATLSPPTTSSNCSGLDAERPDDRVTSRRTPSDHQPQRLLGDAQAHAGRRKRVARHS